MDADLGLANIDVLLGLTPKENIAHVLEGKRQLREVIINGPGGVRIMPASSGVQQLTRLTDEQKLLMLEMLDELESEIDILLVDTGAGISDTVLYFNLAAQEKIVVITPGAHFPHGRLRPHQGALHPIRRAPFPGAGQLRGG